MWTSSDVLWGPRVEFSVLAQSPSQKYRKHTAKLAPRTRRRSNAYLFHSWMGKRIQRFLIPSLLRDEEKIVKCCAKSDNDLNERDSFGQHGPLLTNYLVEEPWILESSIVPHHVSDLDNSVDNNNERDVLKYTHGDKSDNDVNEGDSFEQHSPLLANYLVEEPWIFEPSITPSTVNMVSNVLRNEFDEDEVTQSTLNKQDQLIPENMLHVEESNAMTEEDSVATVILINSSMCTFQRIAVLENDELVELLLEPVKTNVQSDSVYLGVVTKLVPHMGGAFVNIGSPRLALMGIKPHVEPFIFYSFLGPVKEREVNGSIFSKAEEQVDFHENEAFSSGVEERDEVEDEQSDDEFINNEFEGHENRFLFNVIEAIKENANGSVIEHEHEANKQGLFGQLNGYVYQLQTKSAHQDTSINGIGTEENKWARVKEGSKIIVQVVKEGLGTKGPTLTAYPKLKSRFWILMTRCNRIGISKKISGAERARLRDIAKTLQPPGFGLTVRTVASGHSTEELRRDLEGLLSTWKSIMDHATSAALAADEGVDGAVPVMLNRAIGQTLSVVQDYFNEKVKSMVVDSPQTYNEVTTYLQDIAPSLCDRIELHSKRTPLFDEYNIEEEINNILSKRVPLADGGYLVIEQTEALVSIDVNGGQRMLGQGTSQEKAVLQVNLAAARQIARELRLRDIGGIIVVDFIDMLDDSYKRLVYEEVKKAVERDRSTVKVSELSRHWLMEITRKRVRPSIPSMISEPCTCCHATGRVQALEAIFSKIELEICRLLSKMDQKADPESPKSWPQFVIRVDQHMCTFLTTGKRTRLAVLSSSLKVWILLKVARGFTRGGFELKPLTDENIDREQNDAAAISVLRPKEVVTYSARGRKVTLFPIKKYKTAGDK